MKRRPILVLGTATCLALSVGCQGPAGLPEAEQAAIRQAEASFVKLVNARDWKGAVAAYAEDSIVLLPNQAAAQGKAAIQAWLEALPPLSDFQLHGVEIEGRGDLAYCRGTYSMRVAPAGAAPIEDRGKYIAIWRKQADGSWKVLRDIWNSDLPLPVPPAAASRAKKK